MCNHKKPVPPTEEEIKLLEYATLCNIYMGTWGHDEDSMMLKFFYKFHYDDTFRERIKNGCFNLLDECVPTVCGVCKPVTDREMANVPDEHFYEIEDKRDYDDVVVKIREEFSKKLVSDTDFNRYIMNQNDSDLDTDSFVSDSELELCPPEKPSSREWIRHPVKTGASVCQKAKNTENGNDEDTDKSDYQCQSEVERLKCKNLFPRTDLASLQNSTFDLMKKRFQDKLEDEEYGIAWRPKGNYVYKIPKYGRKNTKP
ncbi:Hypothetical protein NTJ_14962 [Nesidiocoris tenuis]|nr:Hypothetical protein NTJ_14962 [Nesidiocoris tenuis]